MRVAHLSFDLGSRHERGHRVHHDDVERAGTDEDLGDLERLLARIGLRHQQVFDIDAQLLRVPHVERVLGVDERRHAPILLRVRDDVQGEGRLSRGLRTEDLRDARPRDAADPGTVVEVDRPRRNRRDPHSRPFGSEPHDGSLAVGPFDLVEGHGQRLLLFPIHLHTHFTLSRFRRVRRADAGDVGHPPRRKLTIPRRMTFRNFFGFAPTAKSGRPESGWSDVSTGVQERGSGAGRASLRVRG